MKTNPLAGNPPNIINIYSRSKDPRSRIISNFAHTPFVLDDEQIASMEGFHQGIKFENIEERRHVFGLCGTEARKQRVKVNKPGIRYCYWGDEKFVSRSQQYYQLYHRAMLAKFTQSHEAREALLATGDDFFGHRVPRVKYNFEEFQKSHLCQSLYQIREALKSDVVFELQRLDKVA